MPPPLSPAEVPLLFDVISEVPDLIAAIIVLLGVLGFSAMLK